MINSSNPLRYNSFTVNSAYNFHFVENEPNIKTKHLSQALVVAAHTLTIKPELRFNFNSVNQVNVLKDYEVTGSRAATA